MPIRYALASLELGLRWLQDRGRPPGPWLFMQQIHSAACLELGLRWLHDRAARPIQRMLKIQCCANLELGLRWLNDRSKDGERSFHTGWI